MYKATPPPIYGASPPSMHGGALPPPPPPPPPVGVLGRGRGRGRPATRKSNLKPLLWNKVTRAVQGSVWEEFQRRGEPQSFSEIDVSELETLFRNKTIEEELIVEASLNPEKILLIDLRRANNAEIMLTKVKMPLPDMVAAILAMDDEKIDSDQVENCLKFCPTKEEMEKLKSFTGNFEKLGKCEQYFMELMMVPRMETKLTVFLFKMQFNVRLSDFKKSLNTVNSACNEVHESIKFKEILKRILYLGNTLNQGTTRGAAVGFKLDSLLRLCDTRSSNSKMTLMHYLCKVLASKSPTLLDFHEDLVSLEAATKIQLKVLAEEMQAILKGLEKVKPELDASANDGPIFEGFHKTLKEFVRQAEEEMTSVTNFYSDVVKNAHALALYFGEDPARCPFEQATLTLLNFVRLFQICHKENIKQVELDKKKAEKEVEMENEKDFNGGQSSEPPVKHFSQTMEPGPSTLPPNKKSNFQLTNDYFVPHLRAAILTMDDELIDSDQVQYCLNFCIMKQETEQLKNYRGDYDKLSIHEQYVLELMKVPRMEEKLRVFLFKIHFNDQISKFKRSLNTVNSACNEVRESVKLKEIMKIVLYLGNRSNQETDKVGFKLEYLLELTDTQASNNKMTLLHYLCKILDSKSPSLLDLHEDLVNLDAATKIELKDLAEEWPAIIQGMEKAKQELVASANEGPVTEVFHKTLEEFYVQADMEVTSVTNFYFNVSEKADALTRYFGEDPNHCPFEQVTLTLLNFVRLFQKCDEEIRKQKAEMDEKIDQLVEELDKFTSTYRQRMELEKEKIHVKEKTP